MTENLESPKRLPLLFYHVGYYGTEFGTRRLFLSQVFVLSEDKVQWMAKNHTREIPDPEINSKDLPVIENAGIGRYSLKSYTLSRRPAIVFVHVLGTVFRDVSNGMVVLESIPAYIWENPGCTVFRIIRCRVPWLKILRRWTITVFHLVIMHVPNRRSPRGSQARYFNFRSGSRWNRQLRRVNRYRGRADLDCDLPLTMSLFLFPAEAPGAWFV